MIVVHSESRNRNYRAHKLNKEHVTITSGTMILFKGTPNKKRFYFYENLPVPTKMAFFSRRPIFLAILLNEQFLHLAQINKQLLSTQQHAYTSFFGYFLV